MPKMISLRTFRLSTTAGYIVNVVAREPFDVPQNAMQAAMEAGCVPVDAEDAPVFEDKSRAVVEFQGDTKRSLVWLVIDSLVKSNNVKDFNGAGKPKHEAVADRLGFTVAQDYVEKIHQEYMTEQSEGTIPNLHPEAQNIIAVIDAQNKAELLELADELAPSVETKGLTVRDLRRALLMKMSGLALGT